MPSSKLTSCLNTLFYSFQSLPSVCTSTPLTVLTSHQTKCHILVNLNQFRAHLLFIMMSGFGCLIPLVIILWKAYWQLKTPMYVLYACNLYFINKSLTITSFLLQINTRANMWLPQLAVREKKSSANQREKSLTLRSHGKNSPETQPKCVLFIWT